MPYIIGILFIGSLCLGVSALGATISGQITDFWGVVIELIAYMGFLISGYLIGKEMGY